MRRRYGRRLATAAVALVLLPPPAAADGEPALICRKAATAAEQAHRIPAQMLAAISLAETGRWRADRGETVAWPWTVYAQGRGRYYANRAAAVAAVRKLRARGVRNIDVGCMQVNLLHHGEAFEDIEAALDPERNVGYAARLLVSLKNQTYSWTEAIGRYHSGRPQRAKAYVLRVMTRWRAARQQAIAERREAVQAEWAERRSRRLVDRR